MRTITETPDRPWPTGQNSAASATPGLLDAPIDPGYLRASRLALLWDRRKSLFKSSICGAALAAVIALLSPVRFTSAVRLMPPGSLDGEQLAILTSLANMAGSASDSSGGPFPLLTTPADIFAGILSSRCVQNGIIEKFELRRAYGNNTWEGARRELSRRTGISVDRKSRVLSIEVTDHDPLRAQAIAQEYISQLNALSVRMDTSASHRERVFLEQRLAEIHSDLESSERDLSRYASANSLIDTPVQNSSTVRSVMSLEGRLIAEQSQLQALRQIYGDENARVRAAQARIAELNRQKQELGGNSGATQDANSYIPLRKLPLLGMGYADLARRVYIDESLFEALSEKVELAKVAEARDLPSVKVLDAPDFPERKVFPQPILMIVVGFGLGFLLCLIWIVVQADQYPPYSPDPLKASISGAYLAITARFQPGNRAAPTWLQQHSNRFGGRI